MAPRKTSFNPNWKTIYPWVNSIPDDVCKAYCKLCKKIFNIAGKGEGSIKEHADGAKHKEKERARSSTQSLQHFFAASAFWFHILFDIEIYFEFVFSEPHETPKSSNEENKIQTEYNDLNTSYQTESNESQFVYDDNVIYEQAGRADSRMCCFYLVIASIFHLVFL